MKQQNNNSGKGKGGQTKKGKKSFQARDREAKASAEKAARIAAEIRERKDRATAYQSDKWVLRVHWMNRVRDAVTIWMCWFTDYAAAPKVTKRIPMYFPDLGTAQTAARETIRRADVKQIDIVKVKMDWRSHRVVRTYGQADVIFRGQEDTKKSQEHFERLLTNGTAS